MQVTYKEELAPVSFIAGDYQEFEYAITDIDTGKAVKADTVKSFKLVLFRYGETETPALVVPGEALSRPSSLGGKEGTIYTVSLEYKHTKDLEGLYIQQPIVVDCKDKTFCPCQGTVNIIARGKEENYV